MGVVFVLSIIVVAYWGTVDEQAVQELQDQLDDIREEESSNDEPPPESP